jgi:hypothetical protein
MINNKIMIYMIDCSAYDDDDGDDDDDVRKSLCFVKGGNKQLKLTK